MPRREAWECLDTEKPKNQGQTPIEYQLNTDSSHDSLAYDNAGCLVTLTDALGQAEKRAYRHGDNRQDRRLKAILNRPGQKLKPDDASAPRHWRYHTAPENLIFGRKAHPGAPEGLHYDEAYRLVGQTRGLARGLDGEDLAGEGSIGPAEDPPAPARPPLKTKRNAGRRERRPGVQPGWRPACGRWRFLRPRGQ